VPASGAYRHHKYGYAPYSRTAAFLFEQTGGQSMADLGMIELRAQIPLLPEYVEPQTPVEQKLAEIWQLVLGVDRVGTADNFGDLGGNSLVAAIIFSKIEDTFAIKIPMATLLQAPTVALLARKIQVLIKSKD
jgi:acyl carrier protein